MTEKMKKIEPKRDEYMVGCETGTKTKKEKPRYPMIRIDLEHIPEAKDWEVVEEGKDDGPYYLITLKVRQIGLSNARYDKSAEFELREIGTSKADNGAENKGKNGEEENE